MPVNLPKFQQFLKGLQDASKGAQERALQTGDTSEIDQISQMADRALKLAEQAKAQQAPQEGGPQTNEPRPYQRMPSIAPRPLGSNPELSMDLGTTPPGPRQDYPFELDHLKSTFKSMGAKPPGAAATEVLQRLAGRESYPKALTMGVEPQASQGRAGFGPPFSGAPFATPPDILEKLNIGIPQAPAQPVSDARKSIGQPPTPGPYRVEGNPPIHGVADYPTPGGPVGGTSDLPAVATQMANDPRLPYDEKLFMNRVATELGDEPAWATLENFVNVLLLGAPTAYRLYKGDLQQYKAGKARIGTEMTSQAARAGIAEVENQYNEMKAELAALNASTRVADSEFRRRLAGPRARIQQAMEKLKNVRVQAQAGQIDAKTFADTAAAIDREYQAAVAEIDGLAPPREEQQP